MNHQDGYDGRNEPDKAESNGITRDYNTESRSRTFCKSSTSARRSELTLHLAQDTGPSSPIRPDAVHASSSTSTTSALSVSQSIPTSNSPGNTSNSETYAQPSPTQLPGSIHPNSSINHNLYQSGEHAPPMVGSGSGSVPAPNPTTSYRPDLAEMHRLSSGIGSLASMRISGGGGMDGEKDDAVPVGFDEGVLRGLCEMDVSNCRSYS